MKPSIIILQSVFDSLPKEVKENLLALNHKYCSTFDGSTQILIRIVPNESVTSLHNASAFLDTMIEKDTLKKEVIELRKLKDSVNNIKEYLK